MKNRIRYEDTRQTHPAKATMRGLRKEFDDLRAHQHRFEADVRLGVAGALAQLREGRSVDAVATLAALESLIAP